MTGDMPRILEFRAEVVGRFAREALASGEGEVCALFRRSFYLRFPGDRYACVGGASLGRGPLNVLVVEFSAAALGERPAISMQQATLWQPRAVSPQRPPDLEALARAVANAVPEQGLGCLILGQHNSLATHAQHGLEAIDSWLAGNALGAEAERLIGLGPGITPSGDDYLGGLLVALRACGRSTQAESLWRWLKPRLSARTSALSAAHLAAAAEGEAHEALHACIESLFSHHDSWDEARSRLDAVGDCSGWDALAGALAVLRRL
ncbi:MAG: hypothetical protein PVSMB6_21910 [Steroidobacteraceae bacterium]